MSRFSSKYTGVFWHAGAKKWMSEITYQGKAVYLGLFVEEDDAARAYDEASKARYGDLSPRLNFREPPQLEPGARAIELGGGRWAIVDECDYERISYWKWSFTTGYASRIEYSPVKKRIKMHHEILQPQAGVEVDHKDRDRLNNRRSNLRHATRAQNMANRAVSDKKRSGLPKGVNRITGGGYVAKVAANGVRHYLGYFKTPEEAARVRDEAAKRLHGEFAVLNYPDQVSS